MPHINLSQIYNNISSNEKFFIEEIRENKQVYIGGVINYNSTLSNGIKFFTQSVFSHTNFFSPNSYNAIGAEELESVTLKDYRSGDYGEFYYVCKKLNVDNLALMYSFKYIQTILVKLGKFDESTKGKLQDKFVKYCYISKKNPKISLKELLNTNYDEIYPEDSFYADIEKFLANKTLLKNMKIFSIDDAESYQNNFNLLKKFIILGIIKHILISLNRQYDIKGTLTTSLTPWKTIRLSGKEYFCSEFVSESLLYAGVYPFDIDTKDPQSITPGDIMDSNVIFVGNESRFYRFLDKSNNGDLVEEIPQKDFIFFKNHIINNEGRKYYFIKKKLFIEISDNILKLIANSIRNSYVEKNPYKSFKPVFRGLVGISLLTIIGLTYIYFSSNSMLADIHTNNILLNTISNNYFLKLLVLLFHFILGFIMFLILVYLLIFYVVPFFRLSKLYILRLFSKH